MKNPRKVRSSVFGRVAWARLFVSAARRFSLVLVLCVLVFPLGGCGHLVNVAEGVADAAAGVWTMGSEPEAHAQLGETEAEGRRRHARNARISQETLMRDLDRIMLTDRPSKLTDKRIP